MEPGEADELRGVVRDVIERGGGSWAAAADAGLLAAMGPESLDGAALGAAGMGAILIELGSSNADLPIWGTLAGLVWLSDREGSEQPEWVGEVLAGERGLALALNEPGHALTSNPSATLTPDDDGWTLWGAKTEVLLVPDLPSTLLVSATGTAGPVVAMVDSSSVGISYTSTITSSGQREVTVSFAGAPVSVVLDGLDSLREIAICGLVGWGSGLLQGARDLTASYVAQREQFGRVLAQFQAVQMQLADVYVTARLVDLTARHLARGIDENFAITADAAIAAYWFAEHAPTALQTCHHLHGGMGVDQTYPLADYFARVKDITRLLGGRSATLANLPITETGAKNTELTESQRAFKTEVRDYFAQLLTRADRTQMLTDRHGEAYHRSIRQMGTDGWMGVGWPAEYGGKGLGGIEQQIFANEAARNDVHLPAVTLQTVGPTLQTYGTEAQKEMFLRRILQGEVHFAIGYSEADAGTDLASLRTSARRDANGDWIINGQKLWTTGGHAADYVWLAARTDPEAPKHRGISIFIVDTRDPGYSWTPIITCDGSHHVNATYYNDVRVPAGMLVGEENKGWQLITTQLNHERIMLGPAGRFEGLRDQVAAWLAAQADDLLDRADVRAVLGRTTAAMRVNELLNWEVAAGVVTGKAAVADASASKVFSSDVVQRLGLELEELVTRYGDATDAETAYLREYLDKTSKRNLVLTFGGGVNEVQRELICMFGLGLPRVPR